MDQIQAPKTISLFFLSYILVIVSYSIDSFYRIRRHHSDVIIEHLDNPTNGTYLSVGAVEVPKLDDLGAGVGPVEALRLVVDGEAVGPRQVGRDDHQAVRRVHPRPLDLGVGAPVGPVHEPEGVGTIRLHQGTS